LHHKSLRVKKIKRIIKDFTVNYARRIRVKCEIEAARSYTKILVNSLFSRENVIRSYGLDANVCYLGVNTEAFKSFSVDKESYVVGVGTISYNKGVHKAIEIINSIPLERRPVLKWIANSCDEIYFTEIRDLALKLNVNFQVHLNIPDSDLILILSRAAVMIYTSRLEPFGLAPLEANACGTYVVALAEGGVRESISNGINGTLISGYNKTQFADVITLFIENLELARIKGNDALNYVSKNWNHSYMAKNIISELEDVLKSS
jgi:glycosyltransferase involved in cell wall biosynthesis